MWKQIQTKDLNDVFSLFNEQWGLLTAGTANDCNTMTVSWGGFLFLWNKPHGLCVVRPQRHTLKYMDKEDYFTLSFFEEKYKNTLTYLGRISGSVEDKITKSQLTIEEISSSIAFKEAKRVIVMKKTYVDRIKKENFIDPLVPETFYPNKDYHYVFYGEIIAIYEKDE